jgi:hypothetical protein
MLNVTGPGRVKNNKIPKGWRDVIEGMPLAEDAPTAFMPLPRLGQQISKLIVFLWLQVFFIVEYFLAGNK